MPGAVSLRFEREPNYFLGAHLAGGEDRTIVAYAGDKLICLGRCSFQQRWMNGLPRQAGYLAELRLDATARGRFSVLRRGYEYFERLQQDHPAELYFTCIAQGNAHARRVLERGARGMPEYRCVAELETLLVAVNSRSRTPKVRLQRASQAQTPGILELLGQHGARHQLAKVWTESDLREIGSRGAPMDQWLVALEGDRVVACGLLWDQRGFRQTVIHGYSRLLALSRPLLQMAMPIFGIPGLPRAGAPLAHAFLSPLAFATGAETMLADFVAASFPAASSLGVDYLTLVLPAGDPRVSVLARRFAVRIYRSLLYTVTWPGNAELAWDAKPFLPEVALL